MLEHNGREIDWRKNGSATKTINYMLGLAATLIATGMIVILWATYWMLVTKSVYNIYKFTASGIDIPFLEIIISPKKLIATWLSGATIMFIGTAIARKELGPDE